MTNAGGHELIRMSGRRSNSVLTEVVSERKWKESSQVRDAMVLKVSVRG